ncbi:DUF3618 domain-containing protein [uncultured Micrococcus sp.]|uniref:DUF3618 domain-containing protein n=1 Tax=uncultured Micrococcus sp. TaxID=114051 RepID=UPI0025948E8E|nr:DUF3618 domain-containing protein [uncultured Micrococcus sp.]
MSTQYNDPRIPQTNDPDRIRAEIERTRSELGHDVDALAEKVSPTKAVSRQTHRVRDGLSTVKESIMGTDPNTQHPAPRHAEASGPSTMDKAKAAAHEVADQARAHTHDAVDQARGLAHDAQGEAQYAAGRTRGHAQHAGDQVRDAAGTVQNQVRTAPAQIRWQTKGNPLAAGMIAFGAGWLVSTLLPGTRAEQQAAQQLHDHSGPIVDEAKNIAGQFRDDMQPAAQEAVAAVKDRASDGVDAVTADGAQKADALKGEAQQAAGEVQGAARQH